jgi:DNA-binding MarR family transcriptional regulator
MESAAPKQPYRRPGWDDPRPHSRRTERRLYLLEQLSSEATRERHSQTPPEIVTALVSAAKAGSALRRALTEAGIDPKLARLVLLFYRRSQLRVADVAWQLGVSPSTASRHLDRAERLGLVDKLYSQLDRRGTWARLTTRGVELRQRVELALAGVPTIDRPRGVAYGIRGTIPDPDA